MIEAMADVPDNSSAAPQVPDPTKLIPVTAEDVERRRMKLILSIAAAALVVGSSGWYLYKHYTDPIHAKQAYDAGVRLYQGTRYEQAILNFDRAVELQPDLADAYLMRARSNVAIYRPDAAVPDFTKVAVLRSKDPAPLVGRAFAYIDLKQWDRAMADASKAIALDPKMANAYNARATAYRAKGDLQNAIEDFTQAVKLDPSLDNYFQRASTYQLLKLHKEAIADFNEAVALAPDQPHTYFARARSKAADGDSTGAREDIRIGRRIDGW
jgi:tetratricopeptide (TPR) repeat protein